MITMISNQKLGALINLLHSVHKYLITYLNCYGSTFLGVNVMRKCVMWIKCNDITQANFWNFSQRIRKGPFVNYISIFLTNYVPSFAVSVSLCVNASD